MMREQLRRIIHDAIQKKFGDMKAPDFSVAVPENPEHGDYATNVALLITKSIGMKPMEVAEQIRQKIGMHDAIEKIEIAAPGFINFWLSSVVLNKGLEAVLKDGDRFGDLDFGRGKQARVEYVSANPTGPIHVGNARGGPIGETICRVLQKCGYKVLREYLDNNIGTQVEKMGLTFWYWYQKILGNEVEFPEGGYQGEYLREIVDEAFRRQGRELSLEALTRFGLEYIFTENMETSRRMGIQFDYIVRESELAGSGRTAEAVRDMKQRGVAREREGALWFAPQDEFLNDRESVIVRSTGQPTYFASDIAYHKEKFTSGYDLVIDIFGSNHHGHVPKLQALTKIYGFDPTHFHVILYQYVRVKRGVEVVKMSKRAGTYITAKEVLDEVGPDSMIFFLLMNAASSHLDFDLELAREQSQKNPVYYVQYAHARCAAIIREAASRGFQYGAPNGENLRLLSESAEQALIKTMIRFPEIVEDTAHDYQVQRIPHYALDLARAFHNFYEKHRVITDDAAQTNARLALVEAARIILKNTLDLIAVAAPEKM